MTTSRKDNKLTRFLKTWGIAALVVFSVFIVLLAKVVTAEANSKKYNYRTYAQSSSRNKYMYDAKTGKWVKEGDLGADEAKSAPGEDPEKAQISEYLSKARESLKVNDFYESGKYVKMVLDMDPGNSDAVTIRGEIDQAILDYEAEFEKSELARIKQQEEAEDSVIDAEKALEKERALEEEARKRAEEMEAKRKAAEEEKRQGAAREARRKAEEESRRLALEEQKRAEEVSRKLTEESASGVQVVEDLEKARKQVELREAYLEQSRKYAEQAFEAGDDSPESRELLASIERSEQALEKEVERIRSIEEAQQRAEADARRRAEEAKAVQERAEKIASYLEKSETYLNKGKYDRARRYAQDAVDVDPGNQAALQMISRVDAEQRARDEELERARREEETAKRAKEISSYLSKAQNYLEKDKYDKARSYANKALEVESDNESVHQMVADIDNAERVRNEELERLMRQQEEQKRAEEQAEKARKLVEEKDAYLEQARKYAQQAMEAGDDSPETRELLASIEKAEKAHQEEIERMRREEETRLKAEEEAKLEAERQKEKKHIQDYLETAQKNLDANKFTNARKYTEKVLNIEKDHPGAMELLSQIDQKEAAYREGGETKYGQKTRAEADNAVEKELKMEAKRKRKDEKIRKNIHTAREHLEQGDYKKARKYAYEAWEKIPHDTEIAVLIADINKEEIFGPSGDKKMTKKDNPLYKYDERSLVSYVTDAFKKETYDIDATPPERVYTIDECVTLAVRNNQRIKVADEQVKLAEMRVWEKRRGLFPDLSFKREWSSGKINSGGFNRHYVGQKYKIEFKHDVFDGFKTWYEVEQTKANLDIINLEREKVRNEIIAETKVAYYNLDKSIKTTEVQNEIKARINALFDIVDKAYQQELVPHVEYLKVKAENIQIDFHYMSSEEDVSLAEMILFQAMDIEPPDHHIVIERIKRPERLLSVGLQNCYNLALANHPDFKIKEKTIEYYELERKMAKSKGWPKVEFNTSIGEAYERFEPLFVNNVDNTSTGGESSNPMTQRTWEREWYAGVKTSMPFWGNTVEHNYVREFWAPTISSFRGSESATNYLTVKFLDDLAYFTNLQETRVGFERSKYEYMKARKDLLIKVKETYFKYRKAMLNREVSMSQVEHKKMLIDVLEERQKFGEMELSRIAQEYKELGENQYGVWQGEADYFISIAKLNEAIGVPDYFDPWQEDNKYKEWKEQQSGEGASDDGGGTGMQLSSSKRDVDYNGMIVDYLEEARTALDKNEFSKARNYTIKALELDGNNLEARDFLSSIDNAEGRYREENYSK